MNYITAKTTLLNIYDFLEKEDNVAKKYNEELLSISGNMDIITSKEKQETLKTFHQRIEKEFYIYLEESQKYLESVRNLPVPDTQKAKVCSAIQSQANLRKKAVEVTANLVRRIEQLNDTLQDKKVEENHLPKKPTISHTEVYRIIKDLLLGITSIIFVLASFLILLLGFLPVPTTFDTYLIAGLLLTVAGILEFSRENKGKMKALVQKIKEKTKHKTQR